MPTDPFMRPVLVIIGPSASGKSTVVRELVQRELIRVHPTWTTRARRPDEPVGTEIEHRFVTDAEFDALAADGFFLGVVSLPGLPYRYALPRIELRDDGTVDTIMGRAPFVEPLRAHFPFQLVYQIEDTPPRAQARLLERGCDRSELAARLSGYGEEARAGRTLAHRVFTNDACIDSLVETIEAKLHLDAVAAKAVSA